MKSEKGPGETETCSGQAGRYPENSARVSMNCRYLAGGSAQGSVWPGQDLEESERSAEAEQVLGALEKDPGKFAEHLAHSEAFPERH